MNPRDLVVLAVAEGSVIASAVLRTQVSSFGVELEKHSHLAWLIATCAVAAAGLIAFVVVSKSRPTDDRKQALGIGLAVVGLGGLLSIAGPGLFEQVLG